MGENLNEFLKAWIPYRMSSFIMEKGRLNAIGHKLKLGSFRKFNRLNVAQNTYLTDRATQKKYFKQQGYTEDKSGNYGLVKKAVGDRKLPIYQTPGLAVDSDNMIPIGNVDDIWYGNDKYNLYNAGHFPTAIYFNPKDEKFYQQAWDLNDYGLNNGGGTYLYHDNQIFNHATEVLDNIGSPVVVTTGKRDTGYSLQNPEWNFINMLDSYLRTKGSSVFTDDDMKFSIINTTQPAEVVVNKK